MSYKNVKLLICSSVVVFALCSCSTTDLHAIASDGSAVSINSSKIASTKPAKVKLYYGNQGMPKHYKVIGRVSADNYNLVAIPHSEESISIELKNQAASIGANGVINITSGLDKTSGDAILH